MEIFPTIQERLQQSTLPNDLKASLIALYSAAQATLVNVTPGLETWRLKRLLSHLADEVLDPETPEHHWPLTLYFLREMAQNGGAAGQDVIHWVEKVRPLLEAFMDSFGPVRLEKITEETMLPVCWLSDTLKPPQSIMVASNVYSLAEANFNAHAWFRAIYAGQVPVGFLMIVDDDQTPQYFLWRFMIAAIFQGHGFGEQAIQHLVEYVRTRPGATALGVSCGQGEGSPEGFYRKLGFVPTGEIEDDEIVLKLAL